MAIDKYNWIITWPHLCSINILEAHRDKLRKNLAYANDNIQEPELLNLLSNPRFRKIREEVRIKRNNERVFQQNAKITITENLISETMQESIDILRKIVHTLATIKLGDQSTDDKFDKLDRLFAEYKILSKWINILTLVRDGKTDDAIDFVSNKSWDEL